FWDAAEATGLPVSFHIGHGTSQVRVAPGSWELAAFSAVGPIQLDEPLAMMIYSGVLERHPRLRLVLAESGIGWLPYFVHRMDAAAEKHVPKARDYRLKARPSEIFRGQVYATFEEEPLGPQRLPLLGPDNFMWASDYPHPDSTFPHSREAIAHAFQGLDPTFVEKVTATNCARRLDQRRDRGASLASLQEHPVRLFEHAVATRRLSHGEARRPRTTAAPARSAAAGGRCRRRCLRGTDRSAQRARRSRDERGARAPPRSLRRGCARPASRYGNDRRGR